MKKHNIFLAPHLDDAALSCGDLICKLVTRDKKCTVITIFSGSPATKFLSAAAKEFHSNCNLGNNPIFYRKMEDKNAMRLLGCEYKHLDFLECLYRTDEQGNHIYPNLDQIYCYNHDKDKNYEYMVEKALYSEVKDSDVVYAPLSIGNHADHIMTKNIISRLSKKISGEIYYYEDIPYVSGVDGTTVYKEKTNGLSESIISISENEWERKKRAVKCYKSQIKIMWDSLETMLEDIDHVSKKHATGRSISLWHMNKNVT